MATDFLNIRKTENLHIVMWLLKDTCWVLLWEGAGMFMVIPTLSVAFYITWKMRHYKAELFHNLAVCSWITANSIWMTGEFFYDDTWRTAATVFFVLGILFVSYFYFLYSAMQKRKLRKAARMVS